MRRSRQDEFRKVAEGSEALYGGRGASKDIFEGFVAWRGCWLCFVDFGELGTGAWRAWGGGFGGEVDERCWGRRNDEPPARSEVLTTTIILHSCNSYLALLLSLKYFS